MHSVTMCCFVFHFAPLKIDHNSSRESVALIMRHKSKNCCIAFKYIIIIIMIYNCRAGSLKKKIYWKTNNKEVADTILWYRFSAGPFQRNRLYLQWRTCQGVLSLPSVFKCAIFAFYTMECLHFCTKPC